MNRVLEAHLRLLSQLPVRVHHWRGHAEEPKPEGWAAAVSPGKLERMRELEAQGWQRKHIAKELNVSTVTIRKKLGPLSRAHKAATRAAAKAKE